MDPIHTCVAILPLAIYLLILGLVNLLRRPVVLSGAMDLALLGFGISGFLVAGPMDLFWPEAAAARFGPYVWVMLLALYALFLTLILLVARPRLVVYNARVDELRRLLAEVAPSLDAQAAWTGDSLHLPQLHVQLHLEPFTPLRNVQLLSTGGGQSYGGWQDVHTALRAAMRRQRTRRNPYGVCLVCSGLVLLGVVSYWIVADAPAVAAGLWRLLRLAG